MSGEESWGADAVAFGRGEAATPDPPARWRLPPRGPRRRLLRPESRTIGLVAGVVVLLVALIVIVGGGSGSGKAPVRAVADPVPRVMVKAPTPSRRREPRHHRKLALKRQSKGQLEEGKREPEGASAQSHEQAAPDSEAAPVAEAEPEAAPVEVVEPEPISVPPTSPAVEFGM